MFSRTLFFMALAAVVAAACDEGGGEGSALDNGLPPGDTDDSDVDVDDCTDVAWGSGLEVGETVANWTQTGYIDSNGDGVVEQEEVEFSLEDVNCDGVDAMVLIIGSST
jgi:hypothetical protein